MTITREHLELAAKAAGYMGVDFSEVNEGGYAWRVSGQLGAPWRPHEVKADAVQLAEDCKMSIDFDSKQVACTPKGQGVLAYNYPGFDK